ncbi:hypothetical protein [Methylobacterium sp. V23]|uniref:hypothetical protein n=1 Tax=Methylobacterium sp. V23 TaxID=2044878 RepID=UPI002690C5EB
MALVSGGVGLTPMMSMLGAIASESPGRPTWYVHGTRNGRVHAMRRELADAGNALSDLRTRTFYAAPDVGDRLGMDYDEEGVVTVGWLIANTPHAEVTYYLCGSTPFLASLAGGLHRAGIPVEQVRFEFFGPTLELEELKPEPALAA